MEQCGNQNFVIKFLFFRMPGRNTHRVKRFLPEWLEQTIEGMSMRLWLKPDPENQQRAICLMCPGPCSFSISEGFTAIIQHNKGKGRERAHRF